MRVRQIVDFHGRTFDLSGCTIAELEDAGDLAGIPWVDLAPVSNPGHLVAVLAVILRREDGEDEVIEELDGGIEIVSVDVVVHVGRAKPEPSFPEVSPTSELAPAGG